MKFNSKIFSKKENEVDFQHKNTYILNSDTPFNIMESFRNLKASLSVAIPKKENGEGICILNTSTAPAEGKTTVTVNLALMFAMSNLKVLLIDADIRKGRVSKYFNAHHTPGLSDYLSGQANYEDIIHQTEQNSNLYTIYQGTQSPRPYELLESTAMKNLSEKLKKEFDYIIIDTPPVCTVSDAVALLPNTDGVMLVARHMNTYESDIKIALDVLRFAKANILGIVVNDYFVNPKKLKGNKKNYYYSGYGYGYSDKESK